MVSFFRQGTMEHTLPKKLVPFFWHFVKPYKKYIAGMVLVALLWALHVSLTPYVLKILVDRVTIYHGDFNALSNAVFWPAFWCVFLSFALGVIFRFYDYLVLKFVPNLKRDIQQQMLFYLEGHSYRYFQDHFAGSLSNKISDMMRAIPEILLMLTDAWLASFLGIVFATITLTFVHPIFSIILLSWSCFYFFVSWLLSRKGRAYATAFAEAKSVLNGKQVDSISNMVNVRLFAQKAFEVAYVKVFTDETVDCDRALQWYLLKVRTFQFLSMTLVTALMLFFLIQERAHGAVTIGDFSLVLPLTWRLMDSLWNVSQQFVRFAQEVGTCHQALSIITPPHEISDHPSAHPLEVKFGQIIFDHVTFHYQHQDPFFEKKQVQIEAGCKVGLVGFSGSGKTTFVHLVLRFFDLKAGRILIDGQDIAHVTQESLHKQIAMIPQDTNLFHRTILENIRYGKPEASDDAVIEAAKRAHCHEFINLLPEGYQAFVGERGVKLSGGQRQRIAIARAILKNAPILILDEATSALDSVTEKQIQAGLHTLMKGKTTLVIAHRLSTLAEMDRILVFSRGHIIEDGTHSALLQKNGHYTHLWNCQAGGFLP